MDKSTKEEHEKKSFTPMAIECGYSQFSKSLPAADIPFVDVRTYDEKEQIISLEWQNAPQTSMNNAAEKERSLAVEARKNGEDGIQEITVVVDGSWAKISFRTNCASSCHSRSSLSND